MAGPGRDDDHDEEVRFALVLNRRVSLAIWMGGVTPEIDRLTRTRPGADSGHESGVRDLWAFKGSFTALLRSPVGSRCRRCCVVTATSCPSCARPSREWCTRLGAA